MKRRMKKALPERRNIKNQKKRRIDRGFIGEYRNTRYCFDENDLIQRFLINVQMFRAAARESE